MDGLEEKVEQDAGGGGIVVATSNSSIKFHEVGQKRERLWVAKAAYYILESMH